MRARAVVDATGAWAADPSSPLRGGTMQILPSRGSHLLVRRDRIPSDIGLTIRVPGKVVFLVPWPGHWIIGTTDNAYEGPIDRPQASAAEVTELIATVNRAMDVDLRPDDIVGNVLGPAPADRAIGRDDGHGVARAQGRGRGERPDPRLAAASSRRTG